MKNTKTFRRLMSLLLIVAMLMSMAVVGAAGAFAADDALSLTYSFKYENAGYAEGRIELSGTADDNGTYYLYWADDEKALDGYAEITTLTLDGEMKYVNMKEFTAIPADATKIIAIKSSTAPATKTVAGADAVYDIPESKQFKYADSDKEYNFQTLSDIHFHRDNYDGYKYAADHFTSALNAAELRGSEFVSTCGDNTNYGDNKEYGMFQNTIAFSDFTGPVYEITGNHTCYEEVEVDSSTHINALNRFKIGTGLDADTDKMRNELYFEVTASNGDHHIYMALELVNDKYYPSISDNFTKAQIDWLEGLLNKYKNDGKKIFIYEHAPFTGYGAGDNKTNPHYTAGMTIDKDLYPQTYRFKELLEANKDIVWFSGHTHIDFKYNYNIDNENGTTAYTVHVPSTASTTTVNTATNELIYQGKADSAQGYFVDVYADATVLNGTDLVKNEILPLYTYWVDYSDEALVANPDYEDKSDPIVTPPVRPKPEGPTITIYFENNWMWPEVSIYYWGGASGENATWPGEIMTEIVGKNGDGVYDIYKMEVPSDITGIVFSGEGGYGRDQSADVTDIKDGYAYYMTWDEATQTKPCKSYPCPLHVDVPDESGATTATTTAPATDPEETVRIYFLKPANWTGAYIYGFEGEIGGTATRLWPQAYPGGAMTLAEKTADGDVYYADVPTSINYVKFCDGTGKSPNYRTDNISVKTFTDGMAFKITQYDGKKYYLYTTFTYEAKADPVEVGAAEVVANETAGTILWGDADQNGAVNVKDATAIQKHIADLIVLTDAGFVAANVDANDNVNVKDATMIQKFVADLIDRFPAEDVQPETTVPTEPDPTVPTETETTAPTEPESSGDEPTVPDTTAPTEPEPTAPTEPEPTPEFTELLATIGETLTNERYYASYVAYAGLKKVYYEFKDGNVADEAAAVAKINTALTAYNTMKQNNPNHTPLYSAPKPGSFVAHGNFTGSWTDHQFEATSSANVVEFTIDLEAASYEFVIHEDGTDNWYKNGTTVEDTCSDLIYSTSGSNTTFVATGGTYKFQFNTSTKKLTVTKV